MATIYYTGCTLDGFIASPEHSLDWLTSRDIDQDGPMAFTGFEQQLGACVMGANTWQWLLDHDESWGGTPAWVVTHRDFAPVEGPVTFTDASVVDVHAAMTEQAGGKDLWVVGGGGLAGQFHAAGLLDEVWLQYAPVTLGDGHPVLPAHVELELLEVARNRDFMCGRYAVVRPAAP
ncbi:MAG: dihydrofolate reductase family protein [Nocardioides sp.]|uniref:dihydrofolate reductase family protein n=1 Tax=Nocardioides sp. TaxID=35761 RepID=UPI003F0B15C2